MKPNIYKQYKPSFNFNTLNTKLQQTKPEDIYLQILILFITLDY